MRAAKAITFFTKGYQETVQEVVKVIQNATYTSEIILQKSDKSQTALGSGSCLMDGLLTMLKNLKMALFQTFST